MNFTTEGPLKPFDPSEQIPFSALFGRRTGRDESQHGSPTHLPPTHLSPGDLSGFISHPKMGTPASARSVEPAEVPAGTDPAAARHNELTRQAEQWVGQTFYGVLLKQMRESPFRSDLFEGGRGGQAYGPLYDQKLIEHMSRGTSHSLVKSLVRKLEAGAAYRKQQSQATAAGAATGTAAPRAVEPVASVAAATEAENRAGFGRADKGRAAAAGAANPYKYTRANVAPGFRP
jgi:Rod binding domain-containing protein